MQGETIGSLQVAPLMYLGIAILMMLPIGLFFLSLVLNQPFNRWLNIIVAILFFVFNRVGLPRYPFAFDKFLTAMGLGYNILTIWYVCRRV